MGSVLRLPNLILSHKYWFLEFSQLPFQGSHETQGLGWGGRRKPSPAHHSETTAVRPPLLTTALPTAQRPPPWAHHPLPQPYPTTQRPPPWAHHPLPQPYPTTQRPPLLRPPPLPQPCPYCSQTTAVSPAPLTTALSQMTDIRSSVPLVPSGIRVKLSFPTAFWAVLKVQWALPVTWRSPLQGTHSTSFLLIFTSDHPWIYFFHVSGHWRFLKQSSCPQETGNSEDVAWH